jgi:hypothetical protein
MVLCYPIKQRHVGFIECHTGKRLDLSRFEYFLEPQSESVASLLPRALPKRTAKTPIVRKAIHRRAAAAKRHS